MTTRRRLLMTAVLLGILATGSAARAVLPDEMLADPVLEKRARDISQQLRCLVCQNQSIDESNAPLARDLRLLVRERLVAGDSDQQAMDFIVARYGTFVLLRPPVELSTLPLWLAPITMVVFGGVFVLAYFRRQSRRPTDTDPNDDRRSPAGPPLEEEY